MRLLISVCLLCFALTSQAATVVQSVTDNSGFTSGQSFDVTISSTSAGNTLLVAAGTSGTTLTGVTAGSALTEDLLTNSGTIGIYRLSNISSGITTVTVSLAADADCIVWVQEVSGLSNSGQPDSTNAWAATTEGFGTSHSEALAPVSDGGYGLVIGRAANGGITWTASGSATVQQAAASSAWGIAYEDGLSQTSDTIAWTFSSSESINVASAVYAAAAASGSTIPVLHHQLRNQ